MPNPDPISQAEVDIKVSMATMDNKISHLETMQGKSFAKMDKLVDEMRKVVSEYHTMHREHINTNYVSKLSLSEHEQATREWVEVKLSSQLGDVKRITDKLDASIQKLSVAQTKLRVRVTQISTVAMVLIAVIQFGAKFV